MERTGTLSSEGRPCPLSGENGRVLFHLESEKIIEHLETYFGRKFPREIPVSSYSICECPKSGLVYAWPPKPAPDSFYAWCAMDPAYYPAARTEWNRVAELMRAASEANTPQSKLLDVGCGDGRALQFLKEFYRGKLEGVDLSDESAEACRRRGFASFSGDFVELISAGVLSERSYDWILSFHCLEHVQDPLGFVRKMAGLLKTGGSLLISTPLSPMSFESDYFDIMNYPPHHMTRWNIRSYEALAKTLGLELKIHLPQVPPYRRRVLQSWKLKTIGRTVSPLQIKQYFKLALAPLDLLSIIRKQFQVRLPDIILVQLKST